MYGFGQPYIYEMIKIKRLSWVYVTLFPTGLVQPVLCQPLDFPIDLFHILVVEEFYGTRYQSGSVSLNNVGIGFHCLRSFSFRFISFVFLFLWLARIKTTRLRTAHAPSLTEDWHLINNCFISFSYTPHIHKHMHTHLWKWAQTFYDD
jgi:hypothetical protein